MHPSQEAAARSLGLTRGQALRYVVLPQAVRRVIPPLLNDFIGLQKDTALVGIARRRSRRSSRRRSTRPPTSTSRTTSSPRRSSSRSRSRSRASPTGSSRATARRRQAGSARRERAARASRACTSRSASSRCCAGSTSTVAEHEVVCLIGASGSGKSTLLRCVNLLEPIDAGRIVRRRRGDHGAAASTSTASAARIGIVFQAFNLFPHMSVLRERHARAAQGARTLSRARPRREATRAARRASGSPTSATSTPTGSRAASSSGSRSCARSRCSPS